MDELKRISNQAHRNNFGGCDYVKKSGHGRQRLRLEDKRMTDEELFIDAWEMGDVDYLDRLNTAIITGEGYCDGCGGLCVDDL